VTAIEELGIPRFRITNGPVGVGMGDGDPELAGHVPDLAHAYGDIIGSETATLGQQVLEGARGPRTRPRLILDRSAPVDLEVEGKRLWRVQPDGPR
jgi:hypothetical protein